MKSVVKKLVCWVLLLLMMLSLAGCEKKPIYDTSPEFNPETDYQYDLMGTFFHNLTESPDGYYYLNSERYLHFIDKATLQDIVVCSKPDCLHEETPTWNGDSDRKVCNAFIETRDSSIFYYKGSLYTVEYAADIEGMTIATRHFYLTEISLDATKRKRIHEIDVTTNSNGRGSPMLDHFMVHRDRFYYSLCYGTNDYVYFYCYDFQTKKTTLLHEGGSVQQAVTKGDYLYLLVCDFEKDTSELYLCTISTGEKKVIGDDQMHFYDTGMFAVDYAEEPDGTIKRWGIHYSLDGKEEATVDYPPMEYPPMIASVNDEYIIAVHQDELLWEDPSTGKIYTNTEYWDLWMNADVKPSDFVVVGQRVWTIFDSHTMEKLAQIPIPENSQNQLFLRDDQLLVFSDIDTYTLYSASISSIGTDNFEWQHSQRVN